MCMCVCGCVYTYSPCTYISIYSKSGRWYVHQNSNQFKSKTGELHQNRNRKKFLGSIMMIV